MDSVADCLPTVRRRCRRRRLRHDRRRRRRRRCRRRHCRRRCRRRRRRFSSQFPIRNIVVVTVVNHPFNILKNISTATCSAPQHVSLYILAFAISRQGQSHVFVKLAGSLGLVLKAFNQLVKVFAFFSTFTLYSRR